MAENKDTIENLYENVTYISAEDNYVKVNYENGNYKLERITLKNLEKMLDDKVFVKTHRSFLVNMNYITDFNGNHLLLNGESIPVSVRRKVEVMNKIIRFENEE